MGPREGRSMNEGAWVHGWFMDGSHGWFMVGGSWASDGRVHGSVMGRFMGGPWAGNGGFMGGSWEVHGRFMGGPWEVHGGSP